MAFGVSLTLGNFDLLPGSRSQFRETKPVNTRFSGSFAKRDTLVSRLPKER